MNPRQILRLVYGQIEKLKRSVPDDWIDNIVVDKLKDGAAVTIHLDVPGYGEAIVSELFRRGDTKRDIEAKFNALIELANNTDILFADQLSAQDLSLAVLKAAKQIRDQLPNTLLEEIKVLDMGHAGFSIRLRIKYQGVDVLNLHCTYTPFYNQNDVDNEVNHIVKVALSRKLLKEMVDKASAVAEKADSDEIFGISIPGVDIENVFERLENLGFTQEEVLTLARMAQTDKVLYERLNRFIEEGADDTFEDYLRRIRGHLN